MAMKLEIDFSNLRYSCEIVNQYYFGLHNFVCIFCLIMLTFGVFWCIFAADRTFKWRQIEKDLLGGNIVVCLDFRIGDNGVRW